MSNLTLLQLRVYDDSIPRMIRLTTTRICKCLECSALPWSLSCLTSRGKRRGPRIGHDHMIAVLIRSRSSIPGKMDNSAADAAMMGGLHSESKVAELRMWLAGDTKVGFYLNP